MMELYKSQDTGRGDYAVTFPGGVLQTGLNQIAANQLARGMNADVESVSLDELNAVATFHPSVMSEDEPCGHADIRKVEDFHGGYEYCLDCWETIGVSQ